MLITFNANQTDEVKLHGPFNKWEGEKMYYNSKMGKFEAYMPVTQTLLFKFTKNGDWVLGDYDIVDDGHGNQNHQVVFNNNTAEKPGMLKRISMSMRRSTHSKDSSEVEVTEKPIDEKMEKPEETRAEEPITADEIEVKDTTESSESKSTMMNRFSKTFGRSRQETKDLPLETKETVEVTDQPSEGLPEVSDVKAVEDSENEVAKAGPQVKETKPSLLNRLSRTLGRTSFDKRAEETKETVPETAVVTKEDLPTVEKKAEVVSEAAEPADVEVLTDDKMEDATPVPKKIDEKMDSSNTGRKESDYAPEEVQKKPSFLKRMKSKFSSLVN